MDRANLGRFYADNIGLIRMVAAKCVGRLRAIGTGMEFEDVVSELTIVFVKSYDLFDHEQGKFSTYFMRSAYNHVNKLAERHERSIEFMSRSVEEMSSWSDDEMDVSEMIPCVQPTQEDVLAHRQSVVDALSELSPLATTVISMTVNPPQFIENEFEAANAHIDYAREQDPDARFRKPSPLGMDFVCSVLRKALGVSPLDLQDARREVIEVFGRNLA
jgi:RNA polymerase sigma factor (sigma-70 family)